MVGVELWDRSVFVFLILVVDGALLEYLGSFVHDRLAEDRRTLLGFLLDVWKVSTADSIMLADSEAGFVRFCFDCFFDP